MGRTPYIGNLPYSASKHSLKPAFSALGKVEYVKLITERDAGQSMGFGFIEMSSGADANAAIAAMNGTELDGRPITVNEAKPQGKNSGGGRGSRGRW